MRSIFHLCQKRPKEFFVNGQTLFKSSNICLDWIPFVSFLDAVNIASVSCHFTSVPNEDETAGFFGKKRKHDDDGRVFFFHLYDTHL
jgi:hypothetical protein